MHLETYYILPLRGTESRESGNNVMPSCRRFVYSLTLLHKKFLFLHETNGKWLYKEYLETSCSSYVYSLKGIFGAFKYLASTFYLFSSDSFPRIWANLARNPDKDFTYNSGIFHNETNWKSLLIIRDEKYDFLKFFEKFLWGWTTRKLFFIRQKIAIEEYTEV